MKKQQVSLFTFRFLLYDSFQSCCNENVRLNGFSVTDFFAHILYLLRIKYK